MAGLGLTVGLGIAAALTVTMGSLTAGTWTFLSSRPRSNNYRRENFIRAFTGAGRVVGGDWTIFHDWAHAQQNELSSASSSFHSS
jgi:hypothetical protein